MAGRRPAADPPTIIGGIDRWTTTTASRSMTRWCAGYRLRLVTSGDFQRGTVAAALPNAQQST